MHAKLYGVMDLTEELLEELAEDWTERLRWVVCRRLGLLPGSWGWRLMTGRRVLRCACHMALDERQSGAGGEDVASSEREAGMTGAFDIERFRELGG